jgi:hypothetical protein
MSSILCDPSPYSCGLERRPADGVIDRQDDAEK